MHPPPQEVAGGPHGGGIHVGLREHAAAAQHRHLLGVDGVVFGLAAVDGFHREGVAQDKRNAFPCAEVGKPVPGADTGDAHDQMLAVGRNSLEKRVWSGWHIPVDKHLSLLVQDAEGHGASMQIDAAVKLVLFRVESHEVSSSLLSDSLPLSAYHGGMLGRGPQEVSIACKRRGTASAPASLCAGKAVWKNVVTPWRDRYPRSPGSEALQTTLSREQHAPERRQAGEPSPQEVVLG